MLETAADNFQSQDDKIVSHHVQRRARQKDEQSWVLDDNAELINPGLPDL